MKILKLLMDYPDFELKAGNLVLSTSKKDDTHFIVPRPKMHDMIVFVFDCEILSATDVTELLDFYNQRL